MKRQLLKTSLPDIKEIEISTMEIWLKQGTIRVTSVGQENIYFEDDWGFQYYCKCYPQN